MAVNVRSNHHLRLVNTPSGVLYPASLSGNKILDQHGDVYLARPLSSWSMPSHLSDADITVALEDAAANHFNGIVAWCGGTEDRGGGGWDKYTNLVGDNFWTGTPWRMNSGTTLGPAWSSVDWMLEEANRLGLVVHFSFCSGFSTFGPGPDWDSATNADMTEVGEALAARYEAYDNLAWHVMFDDTPGATRVARMNALFTGINNVEGATRRPLRWCEVDNGSTTDDQGLYDPSGSTHAARMAVNCIYAYLGDSVVQIEAARTQIGSPGLIGDCEPLYVGNGYPSGTNAQQYRERAYSVFFEGGSLAMTGHECWWPFGADPLVGGCTDWEGVVDDTEMVHYRYCWDFIDAHLRDSSFEASSSFVTTGQGSTDTKAAQGAGDEVAVAYFPSDRTVQVDTTIIAGSANVRLRWYDPTAGTYSSIAASEAQQSGRSVTIPAAHGDGTRDWVLVVDLAVT